MAALGQLFGRHTNHKTKWLRAAEISDGICPGKDPEDTLCKCPDLMYATRIHLLTGTSVETSFYCGCCDLPINPAPGGAGTRPTVVDREA